MKLKSIFQRKRRVMYEDRNTKNLASWPLKFWDFSYASKFIKEHRDDLVLFELRMYGDRDVGETFIENGNMIKALNGGDYQQGRSRLDGVLYTVVDIPAIHVIYKGGAEEWIACYQCVKDDWSYSHRKLSLSPTP